MNDSEPRRCPVTGQPSSVAVDPGPKGWPVVGYSLAWLKSPFTATLRAQRDHGAIAWLRLLGRPAVQVTSAKAIRRILVSNAANYRRGKFHKGLRQWMGDGLITLDGDRWRAHRVVLQPAFNGDQASEQFQHILYGVDKQQCRWDGLVNTGETVDLVDEMNELVTRAFGMALINRDLDKDLIRAVAIASEAIYRTGVGLDLIPSFIPTRYNRRKRWAQRVLDRIAAETAAARRESDDREDVASQLLRSDLPSKAFVDNLRTIFLAGADTTAMALAWALWELARHPQIRDEVEQEADRVLGDRTPVPDDVQSLPVCRAVIDETLRLHPPIWLLPRSANGPDVIDQRAIDEDTTVLTSVFAIHRSPNYWYNPDSFDHRRFLSESDTIRRTGAYLPFGIGKHQCIGKDLALNTLVIALTMLSRPFRIEVDGAEPVGHRARITLQPDPGIRITVHRRRLP